jgi:tripartite-type tricarboxylate transporter receptor subunit TctC
MTLVVNPSSEIQSVEDFVNAAKENPGVLTVGLTGVGHTSHMGALLFSSLTDIELTYVPFGGGAPARTAILGNHVSTAFLNVSELASAHADGTAKMLAVSSPERSELAPNVPTFRELGYDFTFQSVSGIAAPAGVPEDIMAELAGAFEEAAQDPEYLQILKERNIENGYLSRADFTQRLKELDAEMAELWATHPWVTQ